MKHVLILLAACASSSTPAPNAEPQAPKPHVARAETNAVACEKTSTRLTLPEGWQAERATAETIVLTRNDCRAVLVARAGLLADRGKDFDEAWLAAETRARALKAPLEWKDDEASRSDTREAAAKNGQASIAFNGIVVAYAIDELASLTCSFFVVGEARCLGRPEGVLAALERAPRALRSLEQKAEAPGVKNMGPSNMNNVHDPANLAPGSRP